MENRIGGGVERLEGRAMLAAGGLDSSFDGDGVLLVNEAASFAASAFSKADGKIYVAGHALAAPGKLRLFRLNSNGSFDSTFDGDGKVAINFPTNQTILAADVKQLSSGKILVVGTLKNQGGTADIFLARFNANGSRDSSFGTNGIKRQGWGGDDVVEKISVKSDGKIVVIGSTVRKGDRDMVVARYNASGSVDSKFGTKGRAYVDFGSDRDDTAEALRHISGGKIVIAGTSIKNGAGDFALARLDKNGKLDKTFSGDGKLMKGMGGNDYLEDMTIDSKGRILVGGMTGNAGLVQSQPILARFKANGALDTSFDGDGVFKPFIELSNRVVISEIELQPDGKIVVGGTADVGSDHDFVVARIKPNGGFDTTFGFGDGATVTDRPGAGISDNQLFGLTLQADGKILAYGFAQNPSTNDVNMMIARYLA